MGHVSSLGSRVAQVACREGRRKVVVVETSGAAGGELSIEPHWAEAVPTMLAAPDPELVRVEPQEAFPVFHRGIWVLTHADLRNIGRIRATMQWLGELLRVKDSGVWLGYA